MRIKTIILLTLISWNGFVQAQSSGNIGIGTSNPWRARFEQHGAIGATSAIFGGDGAGISLMREWPGIGFNTYHHNGHKLMRAGTGAVQVFDPEGGYMAFEMFSWGMANMTPASRRPMALFQTGRVNIGGGYGPDATLMIERGDGPNGTLQIAGAQYHSHFNFGTDENTYIRAGRDNGKVIINDLVPGSIVSLYGSVGINTATPIYPLQIRQPNADKGLNLVNSNNEIDWELRVTGNLGWLHMYHNGSYVARFNQWGDYANVSDRRLKNNITELTPVLDRVLQLQPVRYEMKDNNAGGGKSIGFIAQDVQPLFPELVSVSSDTASGYKNISDLHTVSYNGFGVLAIKAIQEQQLMIQALQAELDLLKKMVGELQGKENHLTINHKH